MPIIIELSSFGAIFPYIYIYIIKITYEVRIWGQLINNVKPTK